MPTHEGMREYNGIRGVLYLWQIIEKPGWLNNI